MQVISIIISALAVILATGQAYLSYEARNNHIEAIAISQRAEVCADLGGSLGAFEADLSRIAAMPRITAPDDITALTARGETARDAAFAASYVLPNDIDEDVAAVESVFVRSEQAANEHRDPRAEVTLEELLAQFRPAAERIQSVCRSAVAAG